MSYIAIVPCMSDIECIVTAVIVFVDRASGLW